MSPELIAPQRFGFKDSRPTKPSDCYALGMVIYETISGNLPFHEDTDLAIVVKVLEGERPPWGVRFRESLWKVLEQCWAPQPDNRPSIENVLRCLGAVPNSSELPSPEVDEEIEDSDDDCDSEDDFLGVPKATGGVVMTERRSPTPSSPNYPTNCPLSPLSTVSGSSIAETVSETDVDGIGPEATNLDFLISQVDPNDGGAYQVSLIYRHPSMAVSWGFFNAMCVLTPMPFFSCLGLPRSSQIPLWLT